MSEKVLGIAQELLEHWAIEHHYKDWKQAKKNFEFSGSYSLGSCMESLATTASEQIKQVPVRLASESVDLKALRKWVDENTSYGRIDNLHLLAWAEKEAKKNEKA